jgi:hypothetical protein
MPHHVIKSNAIATNIKAFLKALKIVFLSGG